MDKAVLDGIQFHSKELSDLVGEEDECDAKIQRYNKSHTIWIFLFNP